MIRRHVILFTDVLGEVEQQLALVFGSPAAQCQQFPVAHADRFGLIEIRLVRTLGVRSALEQG